MKVVIKSVKTSSQVVFNVDSDKIGELLIVMPSLPTITSAYTLVDGTYTLEHSTIEGEEPFITWQEPPAKKIRNHGYWIEATKNLKANPGQWALFEAAKSATVSNYFTSSKGFERRWITRESGQKDLYLRYVGGQDDLR